MFLDLPKQRFVGRCTLYILPFVVGSAFGQESGKTVIGQGEITGNDVYVRSGASANHYPVCKLNAGDRVDVVSEQGDWLEIKPPKGVFSYISGDFVDTTDDRTGVVNGNRVNVRAGSSVSEYASQKYTVQTQVSRGATVHILERQADGFLKIEPPEGATVWVNRQYVQMAPRPGTGPAPASTLAANTVPSAENQTSPTPDSASPQVAEAESTPDKGTEAPDFHGLPLTDQRAKLQAIDEDLQQEAQMPVENRSFDALAERYNAIANQDQDSFAKRYAESRILQLEQMSKLVDKVRQVRVWNDVVESKRRQFLEARAKINETLPPIPPGLEIQGELRVSSLYPRSRKPERYRLVESDGGKDRTIAYVEIPDDVSIDADEYLGRHVGVRASARRLQSGGVDAIPIYIAHQLVLLQDEDTKAPAPTGG